MAFSNFMTNIVTTTMQSEMKFYIQISFLDWKYLCPCQPPRAVWGPNYCGAGAQDRGLS